MIESLFVVGMFNGTPKSQLITSQTAGLPSLPNTDSDPNAVPQAHAAQSPTSWTWPRMIVSLLFIACGVLCYRMYVKKIAGNR